jgi:hypothetical protein
MSTDYCPVARTAEKAGARPLSQIRMTDLFDGRLEKARVREEHSEDTMADLKFLTDGRNFLCVYGDEKGLVSRFTRRGMMNAPERILQAICDEFDVDIVSEHEPQFWGFETEEELEAAWEAYAEEHGHTQSSYEQRFYNEVVKFVGGKAHDIQPGTIWMIKAEIAKRLIAESPDLLAEDKQSDLIKAVNLIYDRDHAVKVTLTDEDLAFVRLAATHEDDLPQA